MLNLSTLGFTTLDTPKVTQPLAEKKKIENRKTKYCKDIHEILWGWVETDLKVGDYLKSLGLDKACIYRYKSAVRAGKHKPTKELLKALDDKDKKLKQDNHNWHRNRIERFIEMRYQGMTCEAVAAELGLTHTIVTKGINNYIDGLYGEPESKYVNMHVNRKINNKRKKEQILRKVVKFNGVSRAAYELGVSATWIRSVKKHYEMGGYGKPDPELVKQVRRAANKNNKSKAARICEDYGVYLKDLVAKYNITHQKAYLLADGHEESFREMVLNCK